MVTPLDFARDLVQKAGDLLAERFTPFGTTASTKSDHSLVTQADLDANSLITSAIRREFPDDLILSEEDSVHIGTSLLPTWVIDPLDGTTNFSLGLPIWGVSIALLVNGFPKISALHFPILEELYFAEAGEGAFLNKVRLDQNSNAANHGISFFASCSRTYSQYQVRLPYKSRILGSAAYNICSVAKNSAVLCMEVTPKIWDLAGAWLVVEEAGGIIELLENAPLFPINSQTDYGSKSFPLIASKDQKVIKIAINNIQKRKD